MTRALLGEVTLPSLDPTVFQSASNRLVGYTTAGLDQLGEALIEPRWG